MKSPFTIFRRLARAFDALERIDRRLEGLHKRLPHFSAEGSLPLRGPSTGELRPEMGMVPWAQGLGASLKAQERLGREKGYALGGCDFAGTNGFFVRQELVTEELLLPPYPSEQQFEPKKRIFFTPKRPPTQDDASAFFTEND